MFLLPLQLHHGAAPIFQCSSKLIVSLPANFNFVKTLLLFYLSFPTQVALALFEVI